MFTKNMQRITLRIDASASFPLDQEGGYLKLHFAQPEVLEGDVLAQIMSADPVNRPVLRTYTIRHQTVDQIEIDFAMHEGGVAAKWAKCCQIGDEIYAAGPGKKKVLDHAADQFLLIGDMTALPAISVNLELLPRDAQGYAILEILEQADQQDLHKPEGIQLIWLVKNQQKNSNQLLSALQELPEFSGRLGVWLACEFDSMRELRSYIFDILQVPRRDVYASSYWKTGVSEQEHKKIKQADSLAN